MADAERFFDIPDEDGPPGIRKKVGQPPPQFVEMVVESCAVHSASQGWLPGVVIRAATEDGAGIAGTIVVDEPFWNFVDSLIKAGKRAPLDVQAGIEGGQLK